MSEEKNNGTSNQEDEWPEDKSIEDILEEAETKHQFLTSAKEEAEKGGWAQPQAAEDYLMWFEHMVGDIIHDALQDPGYAYFWFSYVHDLAGYIAELRCFSIQPSPKPWECGITMIDAEILEGIKQINQLVHEYGYETDNLIPAFPKFILHRKKIEYEELTLQFQDTVRLVHNVVEQLCCVAVCYRHPNPLQKIELYPHLQEIWRYADNYACKPKDLIIWAISIWKYKIDHLHKGQPISIDAECDIILSHRNSNKVITFTSPIEEMFWKAWKAYSFLTLVPQYQIGKYKVDFAHLATNVVIELDGLVAHGTTEQIANDRRRQREIEALGWRFLRFGGKEIYQDVSQCVKYAEAFISKSQAEKERQRLQ